MVSQGFYCIIQLTLAHWGGQPEFLLYSPAGYGSFGWSAGVLMFALVFQFLPVEALYKVPCDWLIIVGLPFLAGSYQLSPVLAIPPSKSPDTVLPCLGYTLHSRLDFM